MTETHVIATASERSRKQWYAVPANPHQEATAAGSILGRPLALFWPRCWTTVSHARRVTAELRPLIPGMLFVRPLVDSLPPTGSGGDLAWIDSLHRRPGIGAISRDRLLTIPPAAMAVFRIEFDDDGVLRAPPMPDRDPSRFMPGDRVPIVGGPMSGQDLIAEILKVDGKDRVRVLIPLLQRLVETQVPSWFLGEPVSPDPRRASRAATKAGA